MDRDYVSKKDIGKKDYQNYYTFRFFICMNLNVKIVRNDNFKFYVICLL